MKLTHGSTSDLISELPADIIERILQYLPIQDAIRTSLLSRKWRYKWVTLPSLTFDDRDIQFSSNCPAVNKLYKVCNFIDRVLMLHVSPIEKFKLSISYLPNCTSIDQHILFLSKHSIREFILEIRAYTYEYVVPSCLFSCQNLSYLELHGCTFKCLSANEGFNNLKRLHLANITFRDDDQFEMLISCSPLLETLIVSNFENVTHLKIHAPNLKSLELFGSFKSICFVNTPHLASMSISLVDIDEGAYTYEYAVPFCLFSCQNLSYLELHGCTFKRLFANEGFNNLKRLHLVNITFRDDDQFENLISCSPLLETLIVSNFENVTHLKIHAPNLKSLELCGSFESICFVNTPHLASLSISLVDIDEDARQFEQGLTCNLMKVLGDLHGIEELCIAHYFLDYLARGNVPESLPTIYHHLKKLILTLSFDSLDVISAALCLIRNAPNLEELEITAISENIGLKESVLDFLKRQKDLSFSFKELRAIKMKRAENSELEFIKLILSGSPVLETMTIVANFNYPEIEQLQEGFIKKLLQLRRASAPAEIVYSDCLVKVYSSDASTSEYVSKFLEKNQLRVVKMNEVMGLRCELRLIKLILSISPVIETMEFIVEENLNQHLHRNCFDFEVLQH